jgi:small-conductance mechanosensitive channel
MNAVFAEFSKQAVAFAPKALSGLVVFAGFYAAAGVLTNVVRKAAKRSRRLDHTLLDLLCQTLKTTLVIFGLVTALGTIGVNIGAMIAGLGLSGFALGFALKDALSNLLAGVSILLYHPFRPGDRISVTGLEGRVVRIDLRYTTLDTDEHSVLIPNSNIFTNPVTVLHQHEPAHV